MTTLPHDVLVEEALLGRCLVAPHAITEIAATVTPGDFFAPQNGQAFASLVEAWNTGEPHDAVSLAADPRSDLDAVAVSKLMVNAPAGHERLVERLIDLRLRRDLIQSAAELQQSALDMNADPADIRDHMAQHLGNVATPLSPVHDLWRVDDYLNQAPERTEWVIPGLLGVGWRCIVVATEGAGKSVLSRQLAIAASAGIHPLALTPIPPIRSLVIDLENPVAAIVQRGRGMRDLAKRGDWDPDRSHLWHRPAGINVRSRGGRSQLENVIAQARPDLVCIGPLYKLYSVSAREKDEQAGGEVQVILDDLRSRYGFALVIEHHAPKPSNGSRDMLPYGSALWLRWPEIGLKLLRPPGDTKAPNGSLMVDRWRADRLPNAWPDRLDRGNDWPWIGWWERSMEDAMGRAS